MYRLGAPGAQFGGYLTAVLAVSSPGHAQRVKQGHMPNAVRGSAKHPARSASISIAGRPLSTR
jgi:hypothetical protein